MPVECGGGDVAPGWYAQMSCKYLHVHVKQTLSYAVPYNDAMCMVHVYILNMWQKNEHE